MHSLLRIHRLPGPPASPRAPGAAYPYTVGPSIPSRIRHASWGMESTPCGMLRADGLPNGQPPRRQPSRIRGSQQPPTPGRKGAPRDQQLPAAAVHRFHIDRPMLASPTPPLPIACASSLPHSNPVCVPTSTLPLTGIRPQMSIPWFLSARSSGHHSTNWWYMAGDWLDRQRPLRPSYGSRTGPVRPWYSTRSLGTHPFGCRLFGPSGSVTRMPAGLPMLL